jgi:cation transport ATPase
MLENLLDDIQDNVVSTDVDNRAFNEEQSYELKSDQRKLTEIDILKAQVNKLELKNKRYKDNTELRRGLAILFTITINAWLFAVFLILLTNTNTLKLSDSVLITLLTTTTIQVLGMMYVILKNLFPSVKENLKNNNTDK